MTAAPSYGLSALAASLRKHRRLMDAYGKQLVANGPGQGNASRSKRTP